MDHESQKTHPQKPFNRDRSAPHQTKDRRSTPRPRTHRSDSLESHSTLSQLSNLSTPAWRAAPKLQKAEASPIVRTPKRDAQGRSYGTGRRKTSAARVWIKPGSGVFCINHTRDLHHYFGNPALEILAVEPLKRLQAEKRYDVWCTVKGGGLSGQAGAIRHGLARALVESDPELRSPLKQHKLLTRDPRMVERKKVGRHGARRGHQFSKR
jgi:small subunit ribosomal protein S9